MKASMVLYKPRLSAAALDKPVVLTTGEFEEKLRPKYFPQLPYEGATTPNYLAKR